MRVDTPETKSEQYPTKADFERVETQLARIGRDMSACSREIEKLHLQGLPNELAYQSAKLTQMQTELIRAMDDRKTLRARRMEKDITELKSQMKALGISTAGRF